MFDQVFESLRKAADTTLQMQQEGFKRWVSLWPDVPSQQGSAGEQIQQAQKKWVEFVNELVKKQRETLEVQFDAGLKNLEEAFRLAEAKSPEELRARTNELWQKSFACLRQVSEVQLREFQAAAARWTDLVTKGAA